MDKFTRHQGVAAILLRNNIDTDTIIPSVEMKHVSKKGLGEGLFAAWRYTDRERRIPDPAFVLNQPPFRNASILLTGTNFGSGSSREHAVWALAEYGIRAIFAPSYGSIFRANCIASGLLPAIVSTEIVSKLIKEVESDPQHSSLLIDLNNRTVTGPGGKAYSFDIPAADAEMLLNGWDPIDLTLQMNERIEAYQQSDKTQRPWIY